MAFSEIERDEMRTYLGFPKLWQSANPFFESAMTSIQSLADGGSYPDSTGENACRAAIAAISALDGYITTIGQQMINLAVYEVPVSLSNGATLKQDYRSALSTMRREGTNQIMKLAIRLGVQPIRPYFYSDGLQNDPQSAYGNPGFFGGK